MSESQAIPSQAEFKAQASVAERDYHAACAGSDEEAIAEAALQYTQALYYVVDAGLESMAPFTKLVRIMDSTPAWWHEWHTHSVLWRYKWVVQAAQKDPRIPLATTHELLAGMERRYLQHGASLRPVLKCRAEALLAGCGDEPADPVFEQWQVLERSDLCDCVDCEPLALLSWHVLTGRHDEAASLMRSAMERHGEISCFDQPQDFYAVGLEPLMLVADVESASWVQRMGRRLDSKQPTRYNFLRHGHVLARSGDIDAALAMVSLAAGHADRNPLEKAENLARAAGILARVDGDTVGEFWPGSVGTARVVSDSLAGEALEIASSFDERNGNTVVSSRIQELITPSELPALPQVAVSEARPVTSGIVTGNVASVSGSAGEARRSLEGEAVVGHSLVASGQVIPAVREAVAFARAGYTVVDAESALADYRQFVTRRSSSLVLSTILRSWNDFVSTHDRGHAESRTAAGVRLDCLSYRPTAEIQPRVDSTTLDRVEVNAASLQLAAEARFVSLCRILESVAAQENPQLSDSQMEVFFDAVRDPEFAAVRELATVVLGAAYSFLSQSPESDGRADLEAAIVEVLSTYPQGQVTLAVAHREQPVDEFEQAFEQMSALLDGVAYADDIAFSFCLDSAALCWQGEVLDPIHRWMGRALGMVGAVSSMPLLAWAWQLLGRYDASFADRRDVTAGHLVAVARQIAVLEPHSLILFVGDMAPVLIDVDRHLDLLEIAELALAEAGDLGDKGRELKSETYVAAALSCRALNEMDTAVRYAELACELGSEDARVWVMYSWKFRDDDDSLGRAKALRRACECFWVGENVIPALSCMGELVDAVLEADGFDAANAVIDQWSAKLAAVESERDSHEVAIGQCLILVARSSLAFDADRYEDSLGWGRQLLASADAINLVPEILRSYWFMSRSLWIAGKVDEAQQVIVELLERFPENPRDDDFDSCVSLYVRYLMSEGRNKEAEDLIQRYGL